MLKGILAISGQSGLFKLVAEAKNRIIVQSLVTGKRMPVSATAKVSSLEDIAVYTQSADLPLKDVLRKISESDLTGPSVTAKSSDNDLKKYFETMVPDYDKDRVYASDIKKIILWYNILKENDLLNFDGEGTDDGAITSEETSRSE